VPEKIPIRKVAEVEQLLVTRVIDSSESLYDEAVVNPNGAAVIRKHKESKYANDLSLIYPKGHVTITHNFK
jgi:hypothetical protein